MTHEKRNELITEGVNELIEEMGTGNVYFSMGFHTDIFTLSDGSKAQIKLEITKKKSEFEEPANLFIEE